MAHFKKRIGVRGTTWRASVYLHGVRDTATFPSKAAAQSWASAKEAEIRAGERGDAPRKTLRQAMARYRDEVSPARRGHRWERVRLDMLARTMACADTLLERLTARELSAWRDARLAQVAPGSVRREMALLASVLEVVRREWRWLRVNPIRDVTKPPSAPARRRLIADTERDAIIARLGYVPGRQATERRQQVAVGFLLALETGMRAGEVFGLEWSRVHLAARYVTLPLTKNGDARDVPLSSAAVALLESLPARAGRCFDVSTASADTLFRKARDKVGVTGLRFHDSRATAVTRLSKRLDLLDLARMIGHRDLDSLTWYYRATASDIATRLG